MTFRLRRSCLFPLPVLSYHYPRLRSFAEVLVQILVQCTNNCTSILHRALLSRISLVSFTAFHKGLTEVTVVLQPGVQSLKPLPRFPIKYLSLQQVRMNSHSEIILTLKTHNKGLGMELSSGAYA